MEGPLSRAAGPTPGAPPRSESQPASGKLRLPRARVRAVTFDVGATLIECWPSVGHIYAEVAAQFGHPSLSPAALNRNFRAAWQQFHAFSHTPADWSALVDATFRGLLDPPPSRTFFPQLFNRFSEPEVWRIFPDVLPTLQTLRARGVRLGIISNWDERLRPLLEKLKLDRFFEAVVVSCEAGAQKPNRRLFEAACAALEAEPGETLHVGDSREHDFHGALAAGLQARWLRRGKRGGRAGVVGTLGELDKI